MRINLMYVHMYVSIYKYIYFHVFPHEPSHVLSNSFQKHNFINPLYKCITISENPKEAKKEKTIGKEGKALQKTVKTNPYTSEITLYGFVQSPIKNKSNHLLFSRAISQTQGYK